MSDRPAGSFSQGVGEWMGAAEVYDGRGGFVGTGRDTRSVVADDAAGRVTIDVTFDGPFNLSGIYTIADHGSHRVYEGPLNYGYAEALGDGTIVANNYWPDLGLSQRFFLMVLPDGSRQLSLALIRCGEELRYTVVGEYRRQTDPSQPEPPAAVPMDPAELADDPTAGRGQILLHRAGRWAGRLTVLDADLSPNGTVAYEEVVRPADDHLAIEIRNSGFEPHSSFTVSTDDRSGWSPPGEVVGSYSLFGGRALSGQFHHMAGPTRVWRREVASLDGTLKGVVHTWYRGEQRVGVAYGVLGFEPDS